MQILLHIISHFLPPFCPLAPLSCCQKTRLQNPTHTIPPLCSVLWSWHKHDLFLLWERGTLSSYLRYLVVWISSPPCTTGASFIYPFILHTTNAWLLHMVGTKYMFTECMNEWSLYAKLSGYNQLMDFSWSVSCWEGCLGIARSDKPVLETTCSAQRRQVFDSHFTGTRAPCKHSMTRWMLHCAEANTVVTVNLQSSEHSESTITFFGKKGEMFLTHFIWFMRLWMWCGYKWSELDK